jgi:paraquat-inducible protein B
MLPPLLAQADTALAEVGRAAHAVPEVARRADTALAAFEALATRDGPRLTQGIADAAEEARHALAQTRRAMRGLESLTLPTSAAGHQWQQTLRELAGAARAIRALADALEAQPEAVIFGRDEETDE